MRERPQLRVLHEAADVDDEVLASVVDCLDFFDDRRLLPVEEFIDCLCNTYADGWDIESYDCPAVGKIMRYARAMRRYTRTMRRDT